jgi:DNA-binding ferritin-like protein (Dps family)
MGVSFFENRRVEGVNDMDFWDRITGRDMDKQWKSFGLRVKKLPREAQTAWEQTCGYLWQRSDFSGRNIMSVLEGVLDMLEEAAADGRTAQEVFGGDIVGFCAALAGEAGAKSFRDRWRDRLNRSVRNKLGR